MVTMNRKTTRNGAFTLIELLVVIEAGRSWDSLKALTDNPDIQRVQRGAWGRLGY